MCEKYVHVNQRERERGKGLEERLTNEHREKVFFKCATYYGPFLTEIKSLAMRAFMRAKTLHFKSVKITLTSLHSTIKAIFKDLIWSRRQCQEQILELRSSLE